MNIRMYLHCIYWKVKTRIQGEKYHTLRSRCACVWNIYMVANLILLCSLKHISLVFETWKTFCKKTWAILFTFSFFQGGHLSTHCFRYLRHLSIFFNSPFFFFYMNNFCKAPASFCNKTFER